MTCNSCGHVLKQRAEFCPNCGQRIVVTMEEIITSSQDDLATRRGESLNGKLRVGILVVIFLITVLYGFIYLLDKPLVFDGSQLPSIQANAVTSANSNNVDSIEKPFVEPRPLPPVPQSVVRVLGHRREPIRSALRNANGGKEAEYDKAIRNGLAFLGKYQETDGGWPVAIFPRNWPQAESVDFKWGRVGVSSLALLAFFGDGHTWLPDDAGRNDQYFDVTRKAVKFLLAAQDPTTGRFGAGEGERVHFMYNHGMATLALAEATALSGDPELKAHLEKAIAYIVKTQTSNGGWNYYGHQDSDDISVSVWQVQALAAAREAGLAVPDESLTRALSLFRSATKGDRVLYRLEHDDNIFTPSLNGMALMLRQLLGEDPANPELKALAARIATTVPKTKPEWGRDWTPASKEAVDRAKFDPYMLYYCTYGLFFLGGTDWEEWNKAASKALFNMQANDGSFRANDINSLKGGTYYATALCVLTLQVQHRIVHAVSIKGKDE